MIDRTLDFLDPYLVELIWTMIALPILNRFRWIARTKESREALHRALATGVDRVTDALVLLILANPLGFKVDQLAGQVADHVFASVPDALRFLLGKPWFMRLFGMKAVPQHEQRAWIEGMAAGYLKAKAADLLAKLRPDPLTDALRDAGLPAVKPQPLLDDLPRPPYYVGDPPGTIGSGSYPVKP